MLYTLPDGSEEYWSADGLHRQDGPAARHLNGYQAYCQQGKMRREDGPTRIPPDGRSKYYLKRELQRDDLDPAPKNIYRALGRETGSLVITYVPRS